MLKIGEFSKLSRVSIRMLRHYDDIGLLKPAETDNFTGYRYYREEQLFVIGRITALKDMGFSLADIIKIHFPGMKERYIKRYGNAYELPSPKANELMKIFQRICKENGILSSPEECFGFMNQLPEKYPQMSIFDL